MSAQYPPSVNLLRLYERTSQRGRTYLTGRFGGAKIVVIRSDEVADGGAQIWNLLVQQAEQQSRQPSAAATPATDEPATAPSSDSSNGDGTPFDDAIPF